MGFVETPARLRRCRLHRSRNGFHVENFELLASVAGRLAPALVRRFALSSPNDRTFSRVVNGPSERVQPVPRFNDRTCFRVVIRILDALAAKSPVPPIHSALLPG